MRIKKVLLIFFLILFLLFPQLSQVSSASWLLKPGMRDNRVAQIQSWLRLLGYLDYEATGYFGPMTAQAVFAFQQAERLKTDGLVGKETFNRLRIRLYEQSVSSSNNLSMEKATLLSWEKAKTIFPVGEVAQVIDWETGLSFGVYRYGGSLHADCEPCAPEDTAVLFALYQGQWSWERRAVQVLIGDYLIAGSINGMPHGRYTIKNNYFPGHFCLHFYESRLHKNSKIDRAHQEMVLAAAGEG